MHSRCGLGAVPRWLSSAPHVTFCGAHCGRRLLHYGSRLRSGCVQKLTVLRRCMGAGGTSGARRGVCAACARHLARPPATRPNARKTRQRRLNCEARDERIRLEFLQWRSYESMGPTLTKSRRLAD